MMVVPNNIHCLAVITGGLTILYGFAVYLYLPDNPASAHFLSPEERAQSILRIASNHSGIEQKRFKKSQFVEAVRDPKTWLFFLHAWSQEMANGLTNQYSLIIKSFGFSTLETTLLGCINGLTALVSLGAAAVILSKTTGARAWLSAASYVLPVVSCIMLIALPWSNKAGLLVAIYIRATGGIAYSVVMIWAANCSAGHTKKTAGRCFLLISLSPLLDMRESDTVLISIRLPSHCPVPRRIRAGKYSLSTVISRAVQAKVHRHLVGDSMGSLRASHNHRAIPTVLSE